VCTLLQYTLSSFRESLLSYSNAFDSVTIGGVKKCHCGVSVQIGVFGYLTLLVIRPSLFFFMFFMFCLVIRPFWRRLPMPLPLLPLFMQLPPLPLRLLSLAPRNWLFLTLLFLDLAMTTSLLFSKPHRSPPPRCLGPLHSSGYSTRVHPICTMPLTRSLGSLPGCFGGSIRCPSLPTLATLDSFRHVANLLVSACHPHNLKCSISPPVVIMQDDNSF
jgi:hypothetical protein